MAEVKTQLDAAKRSLLDKLADIALPTPVPWIPRTWGWAVLAALVLGWLAWSVLQMVKRHHRDRYRREALAQMDRLETCLGEDRTRAGALAAMLRLLKRVALAAWPRPEVASLSGAQWVAFLRKTAGDRGLSDVVAGHIRDLEYRSPEEAVATIDAADARLIAAAVRNWIGGHVVPA